MLEKDPQRILAVKLRQIGDTVLWTSALSLLRKRFPKAQIEVLVLRSCAPLLEGHPGVDVIHTIRSTKPLRLLKKLLALRSRKFDLFFGFHATTSLCRYAALLGTDIRVLHHHSWKKTPWTATVKINHPGELQNALYRDRELLLPFGILEVPPPPKLYLKSSESAWAKNQLREKGLDPSQPILALLPGSRVETHRYPLDLWTEVLKKEKATGKQILVLSDSDLSREWMLSELCLDLGVPLWDDLSLRQFMSMLSVCTSALGNDSGPIHIAAALGLKTVTLFGPGCKGDFHVYPEEQNRVLRTPIDCRSEGPADKEDFLYCTKSTCDHLSCLRKLTPDQVVESLGH